MRVSALRITKPQAPPPPFLWEKYEDVRDDTLRQGRLWADIPDSIPPRKDSYSYDVPYDLRDREHWLEQQRAKNKARALTEYEWHKPENVAARLIKAKAAYAAQQAQEEARANAFREQLVASEAARILREDEEAAAEAAWIAAQKVARAAAIEAEMEAAAAWWGKINPAFAREKLHPCKFDRWMHYGPASLQPNKGYWLPATVRLAFFKQLGLR